jgi:chemotaxis signal transduction protein
MPWVIVELKHQPFALPAQALREIVPMPGVAAIPRLPPCVRGVVSLRGEVLTLLDLRMRLGMSSRLRETADFCDLVQRREDDHRRWLAELSASVLERRPFLLTLDPHQCAFGRWYDAYRSDDV